MKIVLGLLLAASVIAVPTAAEADEPLFGFIVTTDLLPKDQKEIEQWVTLREGRSNGDFHLIQSWNFAAGDTLEVSVSCTNQPVAPNPAKACTAAVTFSGLSG